MLVLVSALALATVAPPAVAGMGADESFDIYGWRGWSYEFIDYDKDVISGGQLQRLGERERPLRRTLFPRPRQRAADDVRNDVGETSATTPTASREKLGPTSCTTLGWFPASARSTTALTCASRT